MTHEMYAEPGDVVEFFFGGHITADTFSPAIVLARGMGTKLELGRMDPSMHDFHNIDGSPHVDDQNAKSDERIHAGGWRHTARTLATRKVLFEMDLARWNEKTRTIEYAPFAEEKKVEQPAKKSA